jgi:histidine triad (HIT) family protein
MSDCIFCKIVSGEIPSFKVLENEDIVAFLDVMPRSKGMCIVAPKKHYRHFSQDMDSSSKAFDASLIVAEKLKKALEPEAVFFSSLEAQVPHFHVRVYPVYQDTTPLIENNPLETDENELIALAEKIKSAKVDWKRKEKVVEVVKEIEIEKPPEEPKREEEEKDKFSWTRRAEELA